MGDFALFVAYLETLANFTNFTVRFSAQFKQAGVLLQRSGRARQRYDGPTTLSS